MSLRAFAISASDGPVLSSGSFASFASLAPFTSLASFVSLVSFAPLASAAQAGARGAAANVAGLDGYGVDDIVAGENGTVCLWLAGSEEGTTYTFTAGGSTWSATIKTSDTGMLFGRTVVPEGVAVSTLSFAGRRMLLTVSSDNPDWLRLNADGLEVRAFASLGGGGEEEVLPSEATVNADGTATISVSLPEGRNAMFFKVGTGGTDR